MLTNISLKLCPFCGGDAHIKRVYNGRHLDKVGVNCLNCVAGILYYVFNKSETNERLKEAVNAWNRRG